MCGFLLAAGALFAQQKDYATPYDTNAIVSRGITLYDEGRYDEAVREFDRIELTDPQYLWAQYEKLLALSRIEGQPGIEPLFEKLRQSGEMDDYPQMYLLYGSYLSDKAQYDQSEAVFKKGLEHLPNHAQFNLNLGILYLRMERHQDAVDAFKSAVTHNPNQLSAHYFLGALALDNGNIVEGSMALMAYLTLAPSGNHAATAIQKLNASFVRNYVQKGPLKFSDKGDDFSDFEEILRSGLPLQQKYKLRTQIDDVMPRQVQAIADYLQTHEPSGGFFETTYQPWIADVVNKGYFNGFSYYLLTGLGNSIKQLAAQKKEIANFEDNYRQKLMWNVFALRELEHYGKKQQVVVSLGDGKPVAIGPIVNGKAHGPYKRYDTDGNFTGDLNLKDGDLDGLQKYYQNGKITEESMYVSGKKHGKTVYYYQNGNKSAERTYENGELHGPSIYYYPNGGIRCSYTYKNGELDGVQRCFFPGGATRWELAYTNGKRDGRYVEYNIHGDLTDEGKYVQDKLDGSYVTYFDGKAVATQGKYKNDTPLETVVAYYPFGQKERETSFDAQGNPTLTVSYNENGSKWLETVYNRKGEAEQFSYFDWLGRRYWEERQKNGEIVASKQFSSEKPDGFAQNLKAKPYKIVDFDGNLLLHGNFEKGKKTGVWSNFYSNQAKKSEEVFEKGQRQGMRTSFAKNGLTETVTNYTNDDIHGLFEHYDTGVLSQTSFYTEGARNGPFTSYRKDGSVLHKGFLIDNTRSNKEYYYWKNSNLRQIYEYIDGDVVAEQRFDTNGKPLAKFEYANKTGTFTLPYFSENATVTMTLANGTLHGPYEIREKNGDYIVKIDYQHGARVKHQYFGPMGKLQTEVPLYNREWHGDMVRYDAVGNKRSIETYTFGTSYGPYSRFWHNGQKMWEYVQINDVAEGDYKYFNSEGKHILTVYFENNALKHYVRMNAAGEVADKVIVKGETADISSDYPDGKPAARMKYVNGLREDKLLIYGSNNQLQLSCDYKNNLLEGERTEYYAHGKPYKTERFSRNDFSGMQEYFAADGTPLLLLEYVANDLHGTARIYNNGKLMMTKNFNSDEYIDTVR